MVSVTGRCRVRWRTRDGALGMRIPGVPGAAAGVAEMLDVVGPVGHLERAGVHVVKFVKFVRFVRFWCQRKVEMSPISPKLKYPLSGFYG